MSANSPRLENGQTQMELLQENQRLQKLVDQLQHEQEKNRLLIEQLQEDCANFRKSLLAWSRSQITADELYKWITEEDKEEEGFTFEEVMAQLKDVHNKD
jgi:DNA-binding protein H-NS